MKEKISITLDRRVLKELDNRIDGIKIRNRSQGIEAILERALGVDRVAVILAGGALNSLKVGNSYRPLVEIGGQTLIQRNIWKLKKYGFNQIFVIAKKELLSRILNIIGDGSKYGVKIEYVEDFGNGTASSINALQNRVKTTFLVVPGDNEFEMDLSNFWQSHLKNGGVMTLALTTSANPAKICIVSAEGNKIMEFKHYEQKERGKSNLVWSGIYIAEPEFFDQIDKGDKSTELDVVPKIFKKGLLYGYIFGGRWFNIHTLDDLKEAKKYYS